MKKTVKDEHYPSNNTCNEQDAIHKSDEQNVAVDALAACTKELTLLKDKFLRVSADLHNFQARVIKERALWAQEAQAEVFKKVIAIVDDFDRALAEHQKQADAALCQAWLTGFELIGKRMAKMLVDSGVQEIDCTISFDPHLHEAIAHVVAADKKNGDIVEVLQKGYVFNGAVLRPARVSVAQ